MSSTTVDNPRKYWWECRPMAICSTCQVPMRVIQTRQSGDKTIQYRQCPRCGERMKTIRSARLEN